MPQVSNSDISGYNCPMQDTRPMQKRPSRRRRDAGFAVTRQLSVDSVLCVDFASELDFGCGISPPPLPTANTRRAPKFGSAPTPNVLDEILGKMSSFSRSRSMSFGQRFTAEAEDMLAAQRKRDRLQAMDDDAADCVWSCRGCGTKDRSNLVESDDHSSMTCSLCGACEGVVCAETSHQKSQRGSELEDISMALASDDQIESATSRSKFRINAAKLSSTPSSMRAASDATLRRAARDAVLKEEHLDPRSKRRMDASLVFLHATFREFGADPDRSPLCNSVSLKICRAFAKNSAHCSTCTLEDRSCIGSFLAFASTKLVAKTALKAELSVAKAAADAGEAYAGYLDPQATMRQHGILAPSLETVPHDALIAFNFILAASPDKICTPCTPTTFHDDSDGGDVGEGEGEDELVPVSIEELDDDTFAQKLALSTRSLVELGLVSDAAARQAACHAASISCCAWLSVHNMWPPDVVALLFVHAVAVQTTGSVPGGLTKVLKKLRKKHSIESTTIQEALASLPPLPAPALAK